MADRWRPGGADAWALVLLVVLCAVTGLTFLSAFPAPGGDEPGFVDAAWSFSRGDGITAPLYSGLLPGAEQRLQWQPPGYFLLLGGVFAVTGPSLVAARLLSWVAGCVLALLVFRLARRGAGVPAAFAAAAWLGVSAPWLQAARQARMDVICAALICAAVVVHLDGRSGRRQLAAGGLAGIAVVVHPLGLLAPAVLILDVLLAREGRERLPATLAGIAVPLIPYAAFVMTDWDGFRAQMELQLERKSNSSLAAPLEAASVHLYAYLGVAALFALGVTARHMRRDARVVGLLGVLGVAVALYGRESNYFIYYLPALAAGAAWAAASRRAPIVLALVAVAFFLEGAGVVAALRVGADADTDRFALETRALIPRGASVFLASPGRPSPYFALRGRNPMRMALPTRIRRSGMRRLLRESDFVVRTHARAVAGHREVGRVRFGSDEQIVVYGRDAARTRTAISASR